MPMTRKQKKAKAIREARKKQWFGTTDPKSLIKGGIAVTIANRAISPFIASMAPNNPIIQEMRFPLSMIAIGAIPSLHQKDLQSAGFKIATAIALNRFVIPKISGLGLASKQTGESSVAGVVSSALLDVVP